MDRIKRKKAAQQSRTMKPCCGTLCYIAECRGTRKKSVLNRLPVSSESISSFARKYQIAG